MPSSIRKATMADKNILISLNQEFWEQFNLDRMLSSEVLPFEKLSDPAGQFRQEISDELHDHHVYIAFDQDEPVGYIAGKVIREKNKRLAKEGLIVDWYVKEKYRHQGYGEQLFEALTKKFKTEDCSHLAVEAYCDNQDVIDIYTHKGFIKHTLLLKKKL